MDASNAQREQDTAPVADRRLDVRRMNCPLPILKTKAEFASMASGEVLCVAYQREEYVRELEMFSRQTGNPVIHTRSEGDHWCCWIRKA